MATSLPAFRGSFGSTEFFVLTMQAGEFVRSMTVPKELEDWEGPLLLKKSFNVK